MSPLICFPVSPSGRLLDATKNYMWVFLLAGSEVVLSAVVLATCNFLFIGNKSSASADKPDGGAVTEDAKTEVLCSKPAEMNEEEEKGAREEQEKETKEDETDKERAQEVKPESATEDSQEVERFLNEPQQHGC